MREKLFDPKCYELAVYSLEGHPKDSEREREELAYTIQRTIEDDLSNVPLERGGKDE